jgi:N-acetylneuraminate lyase
VVERRLIAETAASAVAGRAQLLIHVGHDCLSDAAELARHAAVVGADVIAAVPPSWYPIEDPTVLAACCAGVADSAPELPFFYAHAPTQTGVQVEVARLMEVAPQLCPRLAGVIYGGSDLADFQRCCQLAGSGKTVLWSGESALSAGLLGGAKGSVGPVTTIAPALVRAVHEAFAGGDLRRLQQMQGLLGRLCRAIDTAGPVAAVGVKALLGRQGRPAGPCRPPLPTLEDVDADRLRTQVATLLPQT